MEKEKDSIMQMVILGPSIVVACSVIAVAIYVTKDCTKEEQFLISDPDIFLENPSPDFIEQVDPYDLSQDSDVEENTLPTFWDVANKTTVAEYEVEVEWFDVPVQIELEELPLKLGKDWSLTGEISRAGVVTNGALAGKDVYLVGFSEMGDYTDVFAIDSSSIVNITYWTKDMFDLPETITLAESGVVLHKTDYVYITLKELIEGDGDEVDTLTILPEQGIEGEVVYMKRGCFFVRTQSSLLVEYRMNVPFIPSDKNDSAYTPSEISFMRIDGEKVTGQYKIRGFGIANGCGSLCAPLAQSSKSMTELVQVGTAETGDSLYVLKNTQDNDLQEIYYNKNTRPYLSTEDGTYDMLETSKYTYDEFLGLYPLLYWQDPLGRIIEFKNTEFEILAEKCKPVIYLYPEEETNLSVWVEPNVGFTKTIPAYGDGWEVRAYPDGTIVDRKTEEHYPYLYWAGLVTDYPKIHEGWSVAQSDIESFLSEKLALLGLHENEIEDFNEYWVTRLSESPYYLLSFVSQDVIDRLSPLTLDKKPDTVLRVLLTAQAIEKPVTIQPQVFKPTPKREGFVVAEWGGVILP